MKGDCPDLLELSSDPVAEALVATLVRAGDGSVLAVLLFGSRLAGTEPGHFSAYDLVAVVDSYRAFFRRLVDAGHHRGSPALLTALARVLAPNVISFDPGLPGGELAKVMVLTLPAFERAVSARAPDHFLKGRMVQRVKLQHAVSEELAQRVCGLIALARRDVLHWTAPYLPEPFSAGDLARRMLEVSYKGEIRPESAGRVESVVEAQRAFLLPTYEGVLAEAAREGRVVGAEGGWRLAHPPRALERVRSRLYFTRSKARATARWLKHVATFDDWLTYIQRKVERRTGIAVEVTPLERKLPLLLLWPKVVRVLFTLRRARGAGPGS